MISNSFLEEYEAKVRLIDISKDDEKRWLCEVFLELVLHCGDMRNLITDMADFRSSLQHDEAMKALKDISLKLDKKKG